MAARDTKLSAAQHRAIDALLENPGVADAARAAGVEHQKLVRWKRDPDFNAALLKAQSAGFRQSMMRLRQGSNAAAVTIVTTMQRGKTPAIRLKAAKSVLRLAKDALAMQQFAAEVDQQERARQDAAPANQPGIRGHGAKRPRLQEKAIAALLTQHSITDAARATGVGRPALYKWMADPTFQARLGAAARIAFGDATMSLLLGVNYAVTLLGNLTADRAVQHQAASLDAALYSFTTDRTFEKEDLAARMATMQPAGESHADSEPALISQTLGRSMYQTLQRLKTGLSPAIRPGPIGFEYIHAADGRPTGLKSVRGPDGRRQWTAPPPGSKAGEPVPDPVAA
jgi:transposase-like protein